MKYKNPNAIPVIAKLNGIEFKATVTEEQANQLFGELDSFDSLEELEAYLDDGDADDVEVEFNNIVNEVEEDEDEDSEDGVEKETI